MKQGRDLQDLAAELKRQLDTKKDYKAPTTELELVQGAESDLRMRVNGIGHFGITQLAHTQIGEHLGIPAKYYNRMREEAPELLTENVNHWFERRTDEVRLVRTLDGNVRSFLSNRYRMIDNYPVANAILPILGETGAQLVSAEVTEHRLYLKAVLPNQFNVYLKPGAHTRVEREDIVCIGAVISNSEVGLGAFSVEGFVERLVCVNGLIVTAGVRRYHIGRGMDDIESAVEFFRTETMQLDDAALMAKMQDVARAALTESRARQVLGLLNAATERPITKPVTKVVEQVAKQFQFGEDAAGDLLTKLAAGGDLSQWGLVNAITNMANAAETYEQATELERIGGKVIALEDDDWRKLAA